MRLTLDLHPIYNDSRGIEKALRDLLDEADAKRAREVEIIPGKGSGALKKTVLRFLRQPEVRARYHRLEKDSDNWGRLFLHFRHDRPEPASSTGRSMERSGVNGPGRSSGEVIRTACACCGIPLEAPVPDSLDDGSANGGTTGIATRTCPACGSPNRLTFRRSRRNAWEARAELDYGEE